MVQDEKHFSSQALASENFPSRSRLVHARTGPLVICLVANWSGSYVDYNGLIAKVGSWGSAGMIIPCALAEGRIRIYLLLGAFGLLFYFGVSLGEIAI